MNTPQTPRLGLDLLPITPDIREIEVMPIPVEWLRYCPECEGQHIFVARYRCDRGFIAMCSNCTEPKLIRPTRTETITTPAENDGRREQ